MSTKSKGRQKQKPVSRDEMIRYMTRHKLKKKQPQIRPRTYANTQGLSTTRLKPAAQPETKKPIISNNVKARLECNLEYLLENQSKMVRRARAPESYISIHTDKSKLPKLPKLPKMSKLPKSPKLPNVLQEKSAEIQREKRATDKTAAVEQIDLTSSMKSDGISFNLSFRPSRTRQVYKIPSLASQVDDTKTQDDVDSVQIRAESGAATPAMSCVSSEFFEMSTNKRRDKQKDWGFIDPEITEPSSFEFEPDEFLKPKSPAKDLLDHSGSKRGNKTHESNSMGMMDSTFAGQKNWAFDESRFKEPTG